MQLFDDDFADRFDFDMLDATKIIPEELVPVRRVGRLVLDRTVDNFFAETEQVAFCTQNVVPGIDFTNDPLLQGRNFSYLDTQLKRLGGPELHAPARQRAEVPGRPLPAGRAHGVRQPRRAGQLRAELLVGRGGGTARGSRGRLPLRRDPRRRKQRVRSERFADHYSQARQFFVSQTPVEQDHIVDAFVFELSKCEQPGIRARMVANLRNVDEDFAAASPTGSASIRCPEASTPARPPIADLPASPALSIIANGPQRFAGRRSACSSPTASTPRC